MNLGPLTIQAPVLLLGLLAAGIPVLLHLLAKVRAPRVFFPTLRFLRMSMDKTARRRRVQHWLLLLLRMAALAVLAMAVAQPLVQAARGKLGSDRDTAAVIVLDNSLSMRLGPAGSTLLDHARDAAAKLLAERNFPEAALIVTNGPRGLNTGLIDRFKVKDNVLKVAAGNGQADLLGAVAQAEELLAASKQPNKEIYLFSDLQSCSAGALGSLRSAGPEGEAVRKDRTRPSLLAIVPNLASRAVPVPGDARARGAASDGIAARTPVNLAVTSIELDQPTATVGQRVFFNVTVRNFGALPQKAKLVAVIDGLEQPKLEQPIPVIPANGSQTVTVETEFSTPGDHSGWFVVQLDGAGGAGLQTASLGGGGAQPGGDDLPGDDRRFFSLNVAGRVKVLLLKQRHEMDRGDDAGFWIRKVAEAALPGENAPPIDLTEVTAADNPSADRLAGRQVLITSNLADLDIGSAGSQPGNDDDANDGIETRPASAIREFIEAGGTWLIFPGPDADLATYNAVLNDRTGGKEPMLDGRLDRYVGSATGGRDIDDSAPPGIMWIDQAHPMFANLYTSPAPYRRVFVYRHAVIHLPAGSASRPIAKLTTNDPLVVQTQVGRGRVLLFATAAMVRWTSWLRQPQALAIRQMILASATAGEHGLRDCYENEQVTVELPESTGPARLTVARPAGEPVQIEPSVAAGRSVLAFDQTDLTGIYKWTMAKDDSLLTGGFVVNVPPAESDLATLDERQLAGMLPDRFVAVGRSVADLDERIEQSRRGSPLWPYLLAVVLVVLAIEAKIANRGRPAGVPAFLPRGLPA